MPLTFHMVLEAYGIEPARVCLLRHQGRGRTGRSPYTLWRDQRKLFEAYQATQQVKDRSRLDGAVWASFVATPDGRTLFTGLFAVQGKQPIPADWPYPLGPLPAEGQDEFYILDRVELFAELEGRLFIDWGLATRAWIQCANRNDKEIIELTALRKTAQVAPLETAP